MNANDLIKTYTSSSVPLVFSTSLFFLIIKVMVLIGLGIYVVFAFVVIRQIAVMIRTVNTPFSFPARLLGYIHFAIAIAVWWFAFTTL